MGCCFSSTFNPNTAATQTNPKRHHSPLKPPILQSQKTPSPPYDDEEAAVIKEVMVVSETPKDQQDKITQTPLPVLPAAAPQTPTAQAEVEEQQEHEEQEQETSHLSQQSEIYTISETVSTTTTATEGLKEDEATSKVKHKSPSKVIKKRPTKGGDSGSFRAPEKRAHGRGRGSGAMRRTVQRNVGSRSRSRSPGNERAGRVGKDTIGRSTTTVTGKTDTKPIGSASARSEGRSKREEDGNHEVAEQQQQQRTESLENPLVSLECFIFL